MTEHCQCAADGYCERYRKEMHGRLREICMGVNVDPGEAANYRAHWLREAGQPRPAAAAATDCPHLGAELRDARGDLRTRDCEGCGGHVRLKLRACTHPARRENAGKPDEITAADCRTCDYRPRRPPERRLLLKNHLCPGDVACMTAAIRSLHLAHPGRFAVAVDTTCPALFEHSPDVVEQSSGEAWERITMHYPLVNSSNQVAAHQLRGYCDFLAEVLGVPVPLAVNRPQLWLSREEKGWMNQVRELTGKDRPYWVVNAGHKTDFTAKHYPHYQEVVAALLGSVFFVQIGKSEHVHRPLAGALNLIDRTDDRQLIRLVYHAQGVLCGTTFLMHLAAAFEKPAVVIAGGREPRAWNQYPFADVVSTVGAFDCCKKEACWRSRTVKLGDGDGKDSSLCDLPVYTEPASPRCMASIAPAEIAARVRRFCA